jgi:molybdopterin-guanine dinucleotide biosynthesis protein A
MSSMPPYAAIVLAGGAATRLGGVDKPAVDVGGRTLLARTLDAVRGAASIVVVGPERALPADVRRVQEDPPGGGPVAAVAAGLRAQLADDVQAATDVVVVLACDMPFVDVAALERLVRELAERPDLGSVVYVDADGRRQYLAAAYRRAELLDAVAAVGDPHGASMRAVTASLTVAEIAAHPDLALDCDTWQDVERTRQILEDR